MGFFGLDEKDLDILCQADSVAQIVKYKHDDTSKLALKGVSPLICTQIRYLQKCEHKIAHYSHANCIIPPLSYEQSSSALTLLAKTESGYRLLDLTCGLGVDTFHYSGRFSEVVTLERDALVARVAVENFKRMGAENITVINSSCEDFIADYSGVPFDMIYVDPARRDEGKRVFLLEDCSPNIIELLPRLRQISTKLVIKLSPMFDFQEVFRIIGELGVVCRAVSVAGECKELIVEINFDSTEPAQRQVSVISADGSVKSFSTHHVSQINSITKFNALSEGTHLYIMDAALRKMRCQSQYANWCIVNNSKINFFVDEDIVITNGQLQEFAGREYEIEQIVDFKPKLFKSLGITSATIVKQNFPMTIDDVRKALKLKDGGRRVLVLTTLRGERKIIITK